MFYKLGCDAALEKLGYGAFKNILGAGKEGLSFLTPEAKAMLTGAGAGAGSGALVGGLADTPGGAAGGALAGAALGGGAGRLGEALSRRFGKAHGAARAFGSTASTAPPTREQLMEQLMKSSSARGLEKLGLGSIGRSLLGAGAGAGIGAGVGSLTDAGAGAGAAIGAGVGGLGGRFSRQLTELAGRGRGKLTELLERRGAGAAEGAAAPAAAEAAAAPQAMGAQEYLFKAPMESVGTHQADIMSRLPEFMQNPAAWEAYAKEKGLDVLTRA